MRVIDVVLVIAGLYGGLHTTLQTFRHIFVLWIEPRESVLTELNAVDKTIAGAKTLEELVAHYREAKAKSQTVKRTAPDTGFYRPLQEAEQNEQALKDAIEGWEQCRAELLSLHYFWWCGALAIAGGLWAFHQFNPWLGVCWLLTGLGLMIYWTSPPVAMLGGQREFNLLVSFKLAYSFATLSLFVALWRHLIRPAQATSAPLPLSPSSP